MKILHLSTFGEERGAAKAAFRVKTALSRVGVESTFLVQTTGRRDPEVQVYQPPAGLAQRLRRFWRRGRMVLDFLPYRGARSPEKEFFSDDRSVIAGWELLAQMPAADLIHLHWVAGLVDYTSFLPAAARRAPLVWRFSDMNPFTGGCHYDGGCGRYLQGCGRCPQLESRRDADLSRAIWRRKQQAYAQIPPERVHLVALNGWMAEKLRESPLLGKFPVSIIPNGLDLEDFAPRNQQFARDILGLPPEARVLLFVADSPQNRRKGFFLLKQALEGLGDIPQLHLVSVGGASPPLDGRIPHVHVGRVSHDRLLSLIYSAADVFVIPSREDNMPNTALEAMACGTPLAGFGVGGIPELVQHGETGLLAPAGDVKALETAIRALLTDEDRRQAMGAAARRRVETKYALERAGQDYRELYEKVLGRATPGAPGKQ